MNTLFGILIVAGAVGFFVWKTFLSKKKNSQTTGKPDKNDDSTNVNLN